MAHETAPFTVDIAAWIREVQQFGYGRTDSPGETERRLVKEGSDFFLKIYNQGTWEYVGLTALKILERIKTVDGSGSGLDADRIDGKEIRFGNAPGSTTGQFFSFASAFSTTPKIVVTPVSSNSGAPYISSRTTTGFTLVTPNSNVFCDYIAIG
jgi:hypothetical protein